MKGRIYTNMSPPSPTITIVEPEQPTIHYLLAPGAHTGDVPFPLCEEGRRIVREILRDWNVRIVETVIGTGRP